MSDKAKNSNDNSQLLMAAATFAIGELRRITSSVLLVLFRMIQGFCRRKFNGTIILFME